MEVGGGREEEFGRGDAAWDLFSSEDDAGVISPCCAVLVSPPCIACDAVAGTFDSSLSLSWWWSTAGAGAGADGGDGVGDDECDSEADEGMASLPVVVVFVLV